MKYTVTKTFMFAMAHRLGLDYPHACKNLHGHEYKVEVTLSSASLDCYGMVIDFREISEHIKGWVIKNWDHGTLVQKDDKATLAFLKKTKQKHFVFPLRNTTAEYMAEFLYYTAVHILLKCPSVTVEEIAIWETATSRASFGGSNA